MAKKQTKMPMNSLTALETLLAKFSANLTSKYSTGLSANPEDQLKGAIADLLANAAVVFGKKIELNTEVIDKGVAGRPDIGISVSKLLAGYVELKAPGKGADPNKLKGEDKTQWGKFKNLPNIIYTDGNEWGLYRNGERVGRLITMSGNVAEDGAAAIAPGDGAELEKLLLNFLSWEPSAPSSPRDLASLLAPLCRYLRKEVVGQLKDPSSNLAALAVDWRAYLFPEADDEQFADAYAQTLTYALLLARLSTTGTLSTEHASKAIKQRHGLLAETLKLLSDEKARSEIDVPVSLLERVIGAVDPAALAAKSKGDPWLYFYEDFLAEYDPAMRKNRGVYFTPVPVVQAQVRLVGELLEENFGAHYSFADRKVVTLDPAAGTGTYILAALDFALGKVEADKGKGMRTSASTIGAENIHAFEVLVGPYAVAHLRFSQAVMAEKGSLPADGTHVYLTDTLDAPHAVPPGHLPLAYKALGEEHKRAQKVKAETIVMVCIGNPPYDREEREQDSKDVRKGGWIRFGDQHKEGAGILKDFVAPLAAFDAGIHAKNLYNDYVYFWRWALWKVFESKPGPGIVSFITASSYLRGPGFAGMRKVMRQTFDELWIIDLEGGNLGARKSENVFDIQTPVAIAIGVRYGDGDPDMPAKVRYALIDGSEADKLNKLAGVDKFSALEWSSCPSGWFAPLMPALETVFYTWPLLTDVFPWQESGAQFKRPWPIGETPEVLKMRWEKLAAAPNKTALLKESRDRKADGQYPDLHKPHIKLPRLSTLKAGAAAPKPSHYAYRTFDRRYCIFDNRVGDYLRPALHRTYGDRQLFLTSLLTEVLGEGPSAIVTELIPDLHHFRGSFGGAHVIPLWRDANATEPNITVGALEVIGAELGEPVGAEDLFAYAYAVLSSPIYVTTHWQELKVPGVRFPIVKNPQLFRECAAVGHRLIWLHTFGNRLVPKGQKPAKVPVGKCKCKIGTPTSPADYPEEYSYDADNQELNVGKGVFSAVRPDVWNFSVSGFEVVKMWLAYRMKSGAGKKSSPLDQIRPQKWTFDAELLDLLWVIDHTIDLYPKLNGICAKVFSSPCINAEAIPKPIGAQRSAPHAVGEPVNADMFDG